jgi:membrane associated rhomboid family serine protease
MIPLTDNHPTHHRPFLTWLILATCVVVFVLQNVSPLGFETLVIMYGLIPAYTVGGTLDPEMLNVGWNGLFSSMFMHGDVSHIAGNMLYLYVFGDNIENALYRSKGMLAGRGRYLGFYLVGGVAAALSHALLDPFSTVPMIGASGAISAVLGAYLVLYPKQPITVALPYVGITELPAYWVLGSWFGYQLLHGIAVDTSGGGVAFWAHIGGFIAGMLLIYPFGGRKRPVLWR